MSSNSLLEQSKRIVAYFEGKEPVRCSIRDCKNSAVVLTECSGPCGISVTCIVHADPELIVRDHYCGGECPGWLKKLYVFREYKKDKDKEYRKQFKCVEKEKEELKD